jgi:hypothetical protein
LPKSPYVFAEWRICRFSIDYHVEVEAHYYSVSHSFVRAEVEVRFTARTVEIFRKDERIAAHQRTSGNHKHTTVPEPSRQGQGLRRHRSRRRGREPRPRRMACASARMERCCDATSGSRRGYRPRGPTATTRDGHARTTCRIERMQEETRKFAAGAHKIAAERRKTGRLDGLLGLQIVIAGAFTGAALVGVMAVALIRVLRPGAGPAALEYFFGGGKRGEGGLQMFPHGFPSTKAVRDNAR